MSRAVFGSLVAVVLALALASRLGGLDRRPMHHDEANQALKFGALVERGEYRYDANDHHGPTLYYLTLPAAWLRGQSTLASLDERTLRAVPAIFGAGLILLLLPLTRGLGRTAVAVGALLVALSPALTYFSRFYIQEALFVFFAIGFLVALGRSLEDRRLGWTAAAGAFAGLAYATKETSVIVLIAAVAAALLAHLLPARLEPVQVQTAAGQPLSARPEPVAPRRYSGRSRAGRGVEGRTDRPRGAVHVAAGLLVAALVAFVFYSSFLAYPAGFFESFRAFGIYAARGIDAGVHAEPWYYYLHLLAYSSSGGLVWTEGIVLALAAVGLITAVVRRSAGFWPRYVAIYAVLTVVAYSAVRYKTPWNLLPFYSGFVLLAGFGASVLIHLVKAGVGRALVVLALVAATCHLGVESWRASVQYPADTRNPYVYAQTVPDFLRLAQRVSDLAAIHPDRAGMLVKVVAGPYEQWPLPWYLRRMTRVGYWVSAAQPGRLDDAPVVVASQENVAAANSALSDRYVSEFYGLRPGVLLTLYIERTLWERLLAGR